MIRRWLGAIRGAIAFLTRLPVPHCEGDWDAFRSTPAAFPVVGLIAGSVAAIPLVAVGHLPATTVAIGYVFAVYAVIGIHHIDGVADFGDAFVVHGDADRRREVLKDTTTGVGALLAVSLTVVGLGLGALGLAGTPVVVAVSVAIGAEVGAKLGMAALACFATAPRPGMGTQFTEAATPPAFVVPAAIGLVPAVIAVWGGSDFLPAAISVWAAVAAAGFPWYWATRQLGGINGDIFGAANEIGRLVGVHAGVIAWTLL